MPESSPFDKLRARRQEAEGRGRGDKASECGGQEGQGGVQRKASSEE